MRKKAASKSNVFGNSTVLDYAQFHVPSDEFRTWSLRQFKLYFFLMESMSKVGERFVVLTAKQIKDGTRIDDSDLKPAREELRRRKLIGFKEAKGMGKGAWNYYALNPATGEHVRDLEYIDREGLTREQIGRYADVRLRRNNPVYSDSSIMATCPLCGSVGSFALSLPEPSKRGLGEWECVGQCRTDSIGNSGVNVRGHNKGKLPQLEISISRRKRIDRDWKAARYSIERIVQNRLIDFDPDAGYRSQSSLDMMLEDLTEPLSEPNHGIEP
jgi:hypothetical protein